MVNKDKNNLKINVHDKVRTGDIVCSVKVVIVPKILLEQAKAFLDSKKPKLYKMCVVLSHTALEVEISRVESAYLKRQGFDDGEIEKLLYQKTNIARNRDDTILLFELITKQKIPQSIDFAKLRAMNTKRNGIVHRGEEVTEQDANDAIDSVEKAVDALEKFIKDRSNISDGNDDKN